MNNKTQAFFAVLTVLIILISCSNDDDNNPQTCNNQGLAYELNANGTIILAPEANLTTDLFPNQSTGVVEIFGNDSNGDFIVFTTDVITLNAMGTGDLIIGGMPNDTVNVTCIATDNVVGGLMRFELSGNYNNAPIDGEYCVTIDSVNP